MRATYNKLVRDGIPEIIRAHGRHAVVRVLDDVSYRSALLDKLLEEAEEANAASADDLPSELADIIEVIYALSAALDMTWERLSEVVGERRAQRGGFARRLFLEYIESADSEAP